MNYGWEGLTAQAKMTKEYQRYVDAQDAVEKARKQYIAACDELENASRANDDIAESYWRMKTESLYDVLDDCERICGSLYAKLTYKYEEKK